MEVIVGSAHPIILAAFLCLPLREVGMPVNFAIFRFALVTPKALFQLNDTPGILTLRATFTHLVSDDDNNINDPNYTGNDVPLKLFLFKGMNRKHNR